MSEDLEYIDRSKILDFSELCHVLDGDYEESGNIQECIIKRGPRSSLVMRKNGDNLVVFDPKRPGKRIYAKTKDDVFECRLQLDRDPYVGGGIGSDFLNFSCYSNEFAIYTSMYASWQDTRKTLIVYHGRTEPNGDFYFTQKEYYTLDPNVAKNIFEKISKDFGVNYDKIMSRFSKQERLDRGWSNSGKIFIDFDKRGGSMKGLWHKGKYQIFVKF